MPVCTGRATTSPAPGMSSTACCRPMTPGEVMTRARRSAMRPPPLGGLAGGEGGAAEGDGDLVGRVADRDAELVHPPGRAVQLQPGAADGGDAAAGPVVDRRADAEHPF